MPNALKVSVRVGTPLIAIAASDSIVRSVISVSSDVDIGRLCSTAAL